MPSSYGVVEQVYLEDEGAASLDWQEKFFPFLQRQKQA